MNNPYICMFVGGERHGYMDYATACKICDGRSEDLTEIRNRGGCVHRPELDNQPEFDGYLGPMWDGSTFLNGIKYDVLRYETQEVYDMLSN